MILGGEIGLPTGAAKIGPDPTDGAFEVQSNGPGGIGAEGGATAAKLLRVDPPRGCGSRFDRIHPGACSRDDPLEVQVADLLAANG